MTNESGGVRPEPGSSDLHDRMYRRLEQPPDFLPHTRLILVDAPVGTLPARSTGKEIMRFTENSRPFLLKIEAKEIPMYLIEMHYCFGAESEATALDRVERHYRRKGVRAGWLKGKLARARIRLGWLLRPNSARIVVMPEPMLIGKRRWAIPPVAGQ